MKGKASGLPSCTKPWESTLTSLLMASMGNTISRTGIRIHRDENTEAPRDDAIFLFTGLGRWPIALYMDLLSFCYLPAQGSAGRYATTYPQGCFQLSPAGEEDLDSGNPWSLPTDGVQRKGKPSESPARCQEASLKGLTLAESQEPPMQMSRQVFNGAKCHQRTKLPLPITAISCFCVTTPESMNLQKRAHIGTGRWDQGVAFEFVYSSNFLS